MAEWRHTRSHPRIPVHLEVRYRDGDDLRSSFVDSLSFGGVFIRTRKPLPIGTELTMEISLENGETSPVVVRGQVVWDRLFDKDGGMGVKFLDEPPEALKKVLTQKGV